MDSRALATILLAALVAYVATAPQVDANGETDASNADLMDYAAQAEDALQTLIEQGEEMNKAAFLTALRLGEGTDDDMGFFRLCGGGNASTLSDHPANLGWPGWRMPAQMAINAGFADGRAVSTAAGAYQITRPTWRGCVAGLGLSDFSQASQDAAAWYLIGQKGAKADVLAGRIESAIYKLRGVWASLPGAVAKQRQVSMADFASVFTNNGGVMA